MEISKNFELNENENTPFKICGSPTYSTKVPCWEGKEEKEGKEGMKGQKSRLQILH